MTRVVIVDDERRARDRLRRLLTALDGVEVVGEAANGVEALEIIAALAPAVVFLDVQMPKMTGLEVASALPSGSRPVIVFVTAHDRYAVEAFEVSATDYVLKPVTRDHVVRALRRAVERDSQARFSRLVDRLDNGRAARRIIGQRQGELRVLPIQSVDAFIVKDESVFAVTSEGRFRVDKSLKELEDALAPLQFARVHRSTLVNLSSVHVVQPVVRSGATARLRNGEVVAISRRYIQAFRRRLGW
jgi:two-component system LytT family response regulator